MAASTYDDALARLLAHEGGYSNHPADPGGPTKFGITIHDYRRHLNPDATAADVKAMSVEEAKRIYRAKYWDAQRCDELPAGVDYAVFDYGVNSGIGRSKKVLQRVVGVKADGVLGPVTMRAVRAREPKAVIVAICDERLRFLKRLRTWPVFGKGWGRRVAQVKSAALAMAEAGSAPDVRGAVANGKASKEPASAARTLAVGSAGAAAVAAAGHGAGLRWWQVALVALAALVAGCAAICFVSQKDLTMPDKLKAWFKHSVTILWARAMTFAGAVLATLLSLSSDPDVGGAIQRVLKPELIPYYVIAIGILTELARRRTARR